MSKNDYFDKTIRILKFSGMWVPSDNEKPLYKYFIWAYNFINIFYPVVFFTFVEFLILPTTAKDLNDLMKNLNMASNHLFTGGKVFTWYYYRKEIMKIIEILDRNLVSYEAVADFNPEKIVKADKKVIDRFTIVFTSLAAFTSLSAWAYTFGVLFFDSENQWSYEVDDNNVTTQIYDQKLPYYSYIFWDHRKSRWHFGWAVMFQCYPVFFYGIIVSGFDTLYCGIISSLGCQMKILIGAFRTVRPRCLKRLGLPLLSSEQVIREKDWVNKELNKELAISIKSLQVLLTICEQMERMFTLCILIQVMNALGIICSSMYLLSTLPLTDERVLVECIYMFAVNVQFFMYCYFGNHLTIRSDEISGALFESDWLSTDTAFKRSMLITMTRMKKPIVLTIGRFSPLTLATFVTVVRASYSFFAVLKTAQ